MSVPVSFKTSSESRLICYCHNLTERDVAEKIRQSPNVHAFADIAPALGINSCSCETRHPLGGNCACAADLKKVFKRVHLDSPIPAEHKSRLKKMIKIELYEQQVGCCGESATAGLSSFLKRQYPSVLDVRSYQIDQSDELIPVPAELLSAMRHHCVDSLPAIVIEGDLAATGGLPTHQEVVELIDERLKLS